MTADRDRLRWHTDGDECTGRHCLNPEHFPGDYAVGRGKRARMTVSLPADLVAYVREQALGRSVSGVVEQAIRDYRHQQISAAMISGLIEDAAADKDGAA